MTTISSILVAVSAIYLAVNIYLYFAIYSLRKTQQKLLQKLIEQQEELYSQIYPDQSSPSELFESILKQHKDENPT